MRSSRFDFKGGRKRPGPLPRLIALADGGVYDNMADQWPSRIRQRMEDPHAPEFRPPDELVVVNASAGLSWQSVKRLSVPLVGEVLALKRDIDVLYDNSATLRRQALVDRFRISENLDGALVHIEQSPYRVPHAFSQSQSSAGKRARAVLNQLGEENEDKWERIAEANAEVATTLSALGTEAAARLVRHGYVLAMANLHVELSPFGRRFSAFVLKPPERGSFRSSAGPGARGRSVGGGGCTSPR